MKCFLKEPQDTPNATLCDEQGKASLYQGELPQPAISVSTTALTIVVMNARNLMVLPPTRGWGIQTPSAQDRGVTPAEPQLSWCTSAGTLHSLTGDSPPATHCCDLWSSEGSKAQKSHWNKSFLWALPWDFVSLQCLNTVSCVCRSGL